MVRVTGIQFEQNGKVYHYDTCGLEMRAGDYVIAQTDKGNDIGQVVLNTREMEENQLASPLKKIVRIATKDDIQHGSEIRMKEQEAFSVCQKKIAEHKLEMKLVSVEMAFDNSKIVFFFTSTLLRSVSDTYITLIRAVSDNSNKYLKPFFFSLASTHHRYKSCVCFEKC